MVTGVIGYIIGKKKRLVHVQSDAELLWQLLTREIYVLMKHYKSIDDLKKEFEKIKMVKVNNPKPDDLEKCKYVTDFELLNDEKVNPWYAILKFSQNSFINMLETGFILNQTDEYDNVFILDFNKNEVRFYNNNTIINNTNKKSNITMIKTATLEEILNFDDMPTKSYTEIVTEMRYQFTNYYENFQKVQEEIDKLHKLKQTVKEQGAANIEEKVDKLLYDMKWERKELNLKRRVFYHRLKALDLIEKE
jgi:hypothetical protein